MTVKYPKGEHIWVASYDDKRRLQYIITSKQASRDQYFLYEFLSDGSFKRFGKSKSPAELEERFLKARSLT